MLCKLLVAGENFSPIIRPLNNVIIMKSLPPKGCSCWRPNFATPPQPKNVCFDFGFKTSWSTSDNRGWIIWWIMLEELDGEQYRRSRCYNGRTQQKDVLSSNHESNQNWHCQRPKHCVIDGDCWLLWRNARIKPSHLWVGDGNHHSTQWGIIHTVVKIL